MEKRTAKDLVSADVQDAEKIVAERYPQLLEWAKLLTRGDQGKAEDIVQELYLHVALAKPDFSLVEKLDSYLYISLKHLYVSLLARASREALHLVSLEDFDSVEVAIEKSHAGDHLQRQNELRRVCIYSAWRKEQSKSFGFFILHYFHGYYRHEVSAIARVPMAAIYNKLKEARDEIKSYLQNSGKLHIASQDRPPEPVLSWNLVSAPELFRELRGYILAARLSECLSEAALLAYYQDGGKGAISRELLAHIVSCERCLDILDGQSGRPGLKDREPLDAIGYFGENRKMDSQKAEDGRVKTMQELLERRKRRLFEHRPRILSIAVNGRVVAFHEVFSERNTLAARTDKSEEASFVEVFSEQGVRLAFLPILELPPEGPHLQSQLIQLSDDRWLRLSLSFDGQGLYSEVIYVDPVLGSLAHYEEDVDVARENAERPVFSAEEAVPSSPLWSFLERLRALLRPHTPVAAVAWSFLLLLVIGSGYFFYQYSIQPITVGEALSRSEQVAVEDMQGQTQHQVLHYEELSDSGEVLQQGTIDLRRDGGGSRYLRRLYNTEHRLIAAEWKLRDGAEKSYSNAKSQSDRALLEDDLWKVDVSPRAFAATRERSIQMRTTPEGYELIASGALPGNPNVVQGTLVLNHQWRFVRQILRVRRGTGIYEVRYERVSEERKPMQSVPDTDFEPEIGASGAMLNRRPDKPQSAFAQAVPGEGLSAQDLAALEVEVLYQLSQIGADSSDPIDIVRTPSGNLRIVGAVAQDSRKWELLARLNSLPDSRFLQVKIASPADGATALKQLRRGNRQLLEVYDVGQRAPLADALIRRALGTQHLSGNALDQAITVFSHRALDHARLSLQESNALYRLGHVFSESELRSLPPTSQQLWSKMVEKHSFALAKELEGLEEQLEEIATKRKAPPAFQAQQGNIDTPAEFSEATKSLLQTMQSIHRQVGGLFASSTSPAGPDDAASLVERLRATLPQAEAQAVVRFSQKMRQ